ncbi:hypothetical protein [Massilia sp.]|uniref:hypothetical protein n=1 Tax=Massilia sp. TaxID=1882437 RepID=UPI0028B0B251|nr:hypothetical protein [Massilia sp.]
MAVMKKGNFSIDIGFLKLGGDFEEGDRQCAWELYTELATRIAVTGKPNDRDCTDFSGEVYAESLTSLHTFFSESRKIMRQFPVCSTYVRPRKIFGIPTGAGINNHLGALIHRFMRDILRPFLETWQADYRFWWENISDKTLPPVDRQRAYPKLSNMISQWSDLRAIMRAIQDELVFMYKLVDVTKLN